MNIAKYTLSCLACCLIFTNGVAAEVTETNTQIQAPKPKLPPHPNPDVRAYLVMDDRTGRVLFGERYDEQIDPASLTKMMTSYVIGQELKSGRLKLTDMVTISENAWSKKYADSSKMFIEVGKQVPVELLNKGIIIQSGNDACIAMAEHIAGSEEAFTALMNEWGQKIGLRNTNFVNAHGLYNENHYSTAYDMALLGRALIRDLPEEYAIYSIKEFTYNGIKQTNRNRLLWDSTLKVDGIKTGHLSNVGYNLVASAVNTEKNMRLISVIIGDVSEKQRSLNSKALLTYGFRFFENYDAVKANEVLATKEIRLGETDELKLGVNHDVLLVIPVNRKDDVKAAFSLNDKEVVAPIAKGQKLGTISFTLDGEILYQTDIVALNEVKEGGFFSRMWDHCVMIVSSWF